MRKATLFRGAKNEGFEPEAALKRKRVCDAYKLRGIKLLNAQCAFNTEFALGKRLPLTKASFGAGSSQSVSCAKKRKGMQTHTFSFFWHSLRTVKNPRQSLLWLAADVCQGQTLC